MINLLQCFKDRSININNFSQEEGISIGTLKQIGQSCETFENTDVQILIKIAHALNMTVDELHDIVRSA